MILRRWIFAIAGADTYNTLVPRGAEQLGGIK